MSFKGLVLSAFTKHTLYMCFKRIHTRYVVYISSMLCTLIRDSRHTIVVHVCALYRALSGKQFRGPVLVF